MQKNDNTNTEGVKTYMFDLRIEIIVKDGADRKGALSM
jgi:hypothetical protein